MPATIQYAFEKSKRGSRPSAITDAAALRSADTRQHAEDSVAIHAHVVISGGHIEHAIEMLALHPQLIFAGSVAGVFAALKHGDDDDLDRDRRRGLRPRCLRVKHRGAKAACGEREAKSSNNPKYAIRFSDKDFEIGRALLRVYLTAGLRN